MSTCFEGRVKRRCWRAGCEVQPHSSPGGSGRDFRPQQPEGGVPTVFVKVTISFFNFMEATKRRHGLANATEEYCISQEEGHALPAGHEVLARSKRSKRKRGQSPRDVSPGRANRSGRLV